ncbi:Retrovirus-related Pol polyprotein from transposon opus, partial [Mucuna pruriens]
MHPCDESKTTFMTDGGATYQRLMDRIFKEHIGNRLKVYVDDMVVKSEIEVGHANNLSSIFGELRNHQLKLNPEKCSFGVRADKFLGFMLTRRGIEANPEKCNAIINMRSPKSVKEEGEGEQRPIYYINKALQGVEQWYQKIEKAALAIITTTRKLRLYFQSHPMVCKTDMPIRKILQKPDVVGKMTVYERMGHMKAQVLADFINELTPNPGNEEPFENNTEWMLSVDGSSNKKGSGAGVILEGPGGVLIEQSLHFDFKVSNNQVEYEAFLVGIRLAKELGVARLTIKSNSQLVKSYGIGWDVREIHPIAYPSKQNERAELLAKLANMQKGGLNRTVIQEALGQPTVEESAILSSGWQSSWRDPIISYLRTDTVSDDPQEARRIKRETAKYILVTREAEAKQVIKEVHEGFLLVVVDYFTKWIKVEPVATISAEKVKRFYWKKIICRFGLPIVIVSYNDTQFAVCAVTEFCTQYGIKKSFNSIEHPQSNGQAEAANRVILKGLCKRLEESDNNEEELRANLDLLKEERKMALIHKCATKARMARRYNLTVFPRPIRKDNLVLRRTLMGTCMNKLTYNWEGSFRV